ncbi:transcriptional regulator [Microlunatus endophyticus]|uniref:Transcriptional regulator n=1 Tax=Microlunatus endophyticus TaxID=1716077 RepID=A0A917S753_9ACTN|nr:YafY family protein [Microlunatus endophyticus]GGL62362.1 transcriptional regulator [Microlunatus endophyticus]
MKRAERLYALVDHLRARSPRTASATALAEAFEVTPRTIGRDILALQKAGVPIYADQGRTGGYAISREFSLLPLQLTGAEALAPATGPAMLAGSPLQASARSARDKIISALPEARHREAIRLLSRTYVIGDDQHRESGELLERAVVGGTVLTISYRSSTGEESDREIEPLGLLRGDDHWYLVGWCRLRKGVRGFRTDRIVAVEATGETAPHRPESLLADDLARWSARRLDC